MSRKRPPQRREAATIDVIHNNQRYHVSYGRYPSGELMEVFVHGAKVGSDVDSIACTGSTILSIALQNGASLKELQQASLRLDDGTPADFFGAVLDALAEEGE